MTMPKRTNNTPLVFPWIDMIPFVVLATFGTWVIVNKPWTLDQASAAAFSGAIYGGAALLLGNWINRVSEWRCSAAEGAQRIEKLKVLLTAELVDVAVGLIEARQLTEAAIISLNAGGSVSVCSNLLKRRSSWLRWSNMNGIR